MASIDVEKVLAQLTLDEKISLLAGTCMIARACSELALTRNDRYGLLAYRCDP